MPNKMDVPQIVRDRSNDQDNTTQSNGAYVQDLKKTTTVLPPAKPFKEKSKQDNSTPKKQKTKTESVAGIRATAKLKGKDTSNSAKDNLEAKKNKSADKGNLFKMEQIFTLHQITELDPEVKAQELSIQFEIACKKYHALRKMLSQSEKASIEQKLNEIQKRIFELIRQNASGATRSKKKIFENEEVPFGSQESSMFGFIPLQTRENEIDALGTSDQNKKDTNATFIPIPLNKCEKEIEFIEPKTKEDKDSKINNPAKEKDNKKNNDLKS